ncbi:MAG: trigger factor [Patescibacteria group bacterium]
MHITREQLSPTSIKLTVVADQAAIDKLKAEVLAQLSQNAKVPGFREGKAPANLVEKNIDQTALQAEFLDQAVNRFYVHAIESEKLRPVTQPQISLTKFVPYSTMEFTAEVEVVGPIQLPDYKKIKLEQKTAAVTADDVNGVIENLRQRGAIKETVTRAAKLGDETNINFKGKDAKTGEPINGTDGADYPLLLGSNSFIPGFEDQLVGLKAGDEKTFTITFPKDYGAEELQSRDVSFEVKVNKVEELKLATLDDAFASTIGPFKTLAELKADIKKQLTAEKQQEAGRAYDNELLEKIAIKSTVDIPKSLVDEEIARMEEEEKRNLVYRGQTWQEHLDEEGIDAEAHFEKQRPQAELRVRGGLVLGEIASQEKITVSPDEVEMRIELLKGQYPDEAMQAELDKPENIHDIMSRMLTEKTLDKLRSYASK